MTQVQRGEKTNNRGDLDTEVIRTFDKEVNSTDNFIFCPGHISPMYIKEHESRGEDHDPRESGGLLKTLQENRR